MSAFYETVARFYDAETVGKTDDLAMYSRLAEDYGGPIFDVGCGTGRVLMHLARQGHIAHGIDDSRQMLDRLDIKLESNPRLADNVEYVHGDVMHYESDEVYSMILLTYNALMHFHDQATQISLLKQLRRLIADDGLLVIDLPNAGETFATQDTDAILLDRSFIDPDTGHMIMLQSHSYMDRVTQILHVQWIYDEVTADGTVKRLHAPHLLRYYFYPEIVLLLKECGFGVMDVFGDYDENPFEDGCERMILYVQPV